MPRYDTSGNDSGMFIDETGLLDEIEKEIIGSWDYISDSGERYPWEISSIYIFGSWARGTAVKGKSDLDVVVLFEDVLESQKFDVDKMWASGEMSEVVELNAKPSLKRHFNGFDVLLFGEHNKEQVLESKSTESRSGRIEGERQVYNLTERRYEKHA